MQREMPEHIFFRSSCSVKTTGSCNEAPKCCCVSRQPGLQPLPVSLLYLPPVLLRIASGVGEKLTACWLHRNSLRSEDR